MGEKINMRTFSVIMPVYNKEHLVAASIESVLNQTYPQFELICVDDGSKDNSLQVIQSFKDNRIQVISQENGGESVARNRGIKAARNEYIAFLDSDDLWLPDYLEKMNNLIDYYPDADVFGCSYLHTLVEEGTLEKAIAEKKNNTDIYIENYFDFVLNHEQSLTASTTTLRKKVLAKVGEFPIGLRNWVDLDLWARVGLYYNVAFTERVCAIYNDVPGSVSKVKAKLHAPTFDNYREYMKAPDITENRKKSFREYVIKEKMYSAYQQYMWDKNGIKAILELLPYCTTRHNRKSYWSMMIQFAISPELFYKILNKLKGRSE